jgi:hypothetical protein
MVVAMVHKNSITDQVEQCRRLAHVLGLTKQMLAHADQGEWEQVTQIELERRDDLVACFSGIMSGQDKELVAEAVATLLHLNEELMAKLKVARDVVMAQGQEITKGRNAAHSYRVVDASI